MIETKGLTGAQTLLRVLGGMGVEHFRIAGIGMVASMGGSRRAAK